MKAKKVSNGAAAEASSTMTQTSRWRGKRPAWHHAHLNSRTEGNSEFNTQAQVYEIVSSRGLGLNYFERMEATCAMSLFKISPKILKAKWRFNLASKLERRMARPRFWSL